MIFEEFAFMFESMGDRLGILYITLAAVDNRYISETEGNDTASEDVYNICSFVPDIIFVGLRLT
jgi:hypothetical protein